jgi:hypothetical protein
LGALWLRGTDPLKRVSWRLRLVSGTKTTSSAEGYE